MIPRITVVMGVETWLIRLTIFETSQQKVLHWSVTYSSSLVRHMNIADYIAAYEVLLDACRL